MSREKRHIAVESTMAGGTDRLWDISDLVALLKAEEAGLEGAA